MSRACSWVWKSNQIAPHESKVNICLSASHGGVTYQRGIPLRGVFGVGGGRRDSATEDCGADCRCTFCWVGERTEEGRRRGRRRFTGREFVSSPWGVVLNWINLLWNARAPRELMFLYSLQIEWVRKGKASRVRRGVFWKAMSWNEIWKGAMSHRVWALHSLLPRHPYVALSEPVSPPAHPTTLPASEGKKKEETHHRSL